MKSPIQRGRNAFQYANRNLLILAQILLGLLLVMKDIKHGLTFDTFYTKHMNMTWYTAYNECMRTMSIMPGSPVIRVRNQSEIEDFFPIWVFAYEVKYTDQLKERYYAISNLDHHMKASYACVNTTVSTSSPMTMTYFDANAHCKKMSMRLRQIKKLDDMAVVGQDRYQSSTFWNTNFTEDSVEEFFDANGNGNTNIRCLLLDENGQLKADNCNNRHNSVCLHAPRSISPTIKYLGKNSTNSIPQYKPDSRSTSTTSKGTSGTHTKITRLSSSSSSGTSNTRPNTNDQGTTTSTNRETRSDSFLMDQDIIIALAVVGSIVVSAIVLAICCCCFCKGGPDDGKNPHLAEAYSETADSVIFKDVKHYENNDVSDYATPEDAVGLKRAKKRDSIVEGEYDTLQQNKSIKTAPKKKIAVVNAYSHVAIVQPNARTSVSNELEENHYDVTSLKPSIVSVISNETGGNIYGHVEGKQS